MNWDPAMLEPSHLAMWRIVLGWLIGLPLIALSEMLRGAGLDVLG